MVKKALIIAAGNGSRLRKDGNDTPKPLRKVAGVPLLKRILLTAHKAGISEFVIVVGYAQDQIRKAVASYNLDLNIEFVENPDWQKSNGISVLAARKAIREDFILLMSDHVVSVEALNQLRRVPLGQQRAVLAVDYKLGTIFDMDDATKVQVNRDGQIQAIDKELQEFNAVDTGMFLCSTRLFSALEEACVNGNCSLSDGIRLLAARKQMGTFNVGAAHWQDVDTKPALRHAESLLLDECRKSTDGWIARNINRRISLWMTKYLVRTNLSANHMTGLTTLVGVASGVFAARGDYWNLLIGAVLFQLASILDGVDGEMSRLTFTSSKTGQWLDTISDNLTYVCFISGLSIAAFKTQDTTLSVLGITTLIGMALALVVTFTFLLSFTDSGSMIAIQKDFQQNENGNWLWQFLRKIQFAIKRDFFALLFMVLALLNQMGAILWLCCIGTNMVWLVLLNYRLGLFKPAVRKEAVNSSVHS